MRSRASDSDRRKSALKWLSTVRQATVDRETAAAYAVGVEDLPAHVVEQACKDLGYAERAAYESAWPPLSAIRSRCAAILRVERERAESRRLLNAAPSDPISPERWDEIKAQFQAVLRRRTMPRSRRSGAAPADPRLPAGDRE